jgi:hypothetical protein
MASLFDRESVHISDRALYHYSNQAKMSFTLDFGSHKVWCKGSDTVWAWNFALLA